MRKFLNKLAGLLAVLVLAAGATVFIGLQLAQGRMQRAIEVPVEVLAIPALGAADSKAVERGRYLYASRGCTDCHGANGGGRTFAQEKGLRVKGPNITTGTGSATASYRPEDWVRSIRHGVGPSGRPLMVMPSEDYNRWTDGDVAAVVAYIRTLPPAEGGAAEVKLPLVARVLYGLGAIDDAAAKIDHGRPPAKPVAEGVNLAHGKYVANMCIGCHGADLAGGRIPGGSPSWPKASNLTPGEDTVMGRYPTAESLQRMFKSGHTAEGVPIQVMPFESLREINPTDVAALHLYLKSLKPLPRG